METQRISWYLSKILFYLGFSPKVVGYKYIKEIIFAYIDYGTIKMNEMYGIISRNHNQTPELIAASVRNALKRANNNYLNKRLEDLMGARLFDKNYNITVGEFFGLITTYLKYCWDGVSLDLPNTIYS